MAGIARFEDIEAWQQAREMYDVATRTERLIGGFMKYLAASPLKGSKLK